MSHLYTDHGPAKSARPKVMLATTAYDAPDASYTYSMIQSRPALTAAGIDSAYLLLSGNCHVDDARNSVVQEFLLSDCDDLVFLDADVSWRPEQLVRLCQVEEDGIIGGVYPYRREGLADNMPIRMKEGVVDPDENGLIEVEGLPTGFMRIRRAVLERLATDAQHHWKDKHDRRSKVPIIFERMFEDGVRWGGDLAFCNKWTATGGKVHAFYEMTLGHASKTVLKGSLGKTIRLRSATTLKHICDEVRKGVPSFNILAEAREYIDNNSHAALEEMLAACIDAARRADGPIIETGSGLTTILMAAAAPDQQVYCIEHHGFYAARLKQWAAEAELDNIVLVTAELKDGWYDLSEADRAQMPGHYAVALNDGPPRSAENSRAPFYQHLAPISDVLLVDDVDDDETLVTLHEWARLSDREVTFIEPRTAIISPPATQEAAE